MATFAGNFQFVEETFDGTPSDEVFLLGLGDENAAGGFGADLALLSDSLVDVKSAIYYPQIGKAAIVDSQNTVKFLSDIEGISFADEFIDLAKISSPFGIVNNGELSTSTNNAKVFGGNFEFVEEAFDTSGFSS